MQIPAKFTGKFRRKLTILLRVYWKVLPKTQAAYINVCERITVAYGMPRSKSFAFT